MRFLMLGVAIAAAILTGCGGNSLLLPQDYLVAISPARHWPLSRTAITYRIEGTGNAPFDQRAVIETGVDRWRDAISPIELRRVGEGEPSDIVISLASQELIDSLAPDLGDTGVTVVKTEGDGLTITGAHCYLLRSLLPSRLDDLSCHEVGHSLGLGHSPFRQDVMAKSPPLGGHLTARDTRTIRLVYRLPLP